jgi:hypothetical protein
MAKDVAQRDIDMGGFRVLNVGPPQNPGDATRVDNQTVPLPANGTGSPGRSLLAAAADHVHPAQGGTPSAIIQLEGEGEEEVTGPTEDVVFQRFVDFGGVITSNVSPVFSAFVSVDSGDTATFNVRLGGTPGAPDGTVIATLTTQAASPQPAIVAGQAVPRPGGPALVKVTGATVNPNATARIADLRVTLTG